MSTIPVEPRYYDGHRKISLHLDYQYIQYKVRLLDKMIKNGIMHLIKKMMDYNTWQKVAENTTSH